MRVNKANGRRGRCGNNAKGGGSVKGRNGNKAKGEECEGQ